MDLRKFITAMVASTLLTVVSVANGAGMVDDTFYDAVTRLITNMRVAVTQEATNLNRCTGSDLTECSWTAAQDAFVVDSGETISGVSRLDARYACEPDGNPVIGNVEGTIACQGFIKPVLGYEGSPALNAALQSHGITTTAPYKIGSNDTVEASSRTCTVNVSGSGRQSTAGAAFAETNSAIASAIKAYVQTLHCSVGDGT